MFPCSGAAIPARWITTVGRVSATIRWTQSRSQRSPCASPAFGGVRVNPKTSWPSSRSLAASGLPVKPPDPVSRIRSERETNLVSPDIGFHHDGAKLGQRRSRLPAECCLCAREVAYQVFHFRGTEIDWIHPHSQLACLLADTLFLDTAAAPEQLDADRAERHFGEITDRRVVLARQ